MALVKTLAAAAALLVPGLVPSVSAQSDGPEFIYPAEKDDGKLAFHDNAEVVVSYKCPTESMVLRIYCNDEEKDDYVHQAAVFPDIPCADEEYSFRVDFDYYAKECWFNMRDSERTGFTGINSGRFSLARTAAEATFGLDQPTESITTSAIPSKTGSTEASLTASSGTDATTGADGSESTTASPNDDSGSGGMSTGVKAGIGVGVSLGVVGIAALIGAFFLVKKRKKNAAASPPSHDDDAPFGKTELPGQSADYKQHGYQPQEYYKGPEAPPSEMAESNTQYYEMEQPRRTHEMQG